MKAVPDIRIRSLNGKPPRTSGAFVLYWMIVHRRLKWNFGLQRAVEWCHELSKPLVILEALRTDYPFANDRLHRFIIDGMGDNSRRARSRPVLYYPYLENALGAGKGLLEALADRACVVVTDCFPCFFLPRMVSAAAEKISTRMEDVDSNGLIPVRATDRVYQNALGFRRFIQKEILGHLEHYPVEDPLAELRSVSSDRHLPADVLSKWPEAPVEDAPACRRLTTGLPINHGVPPAKLGGGSDRAEERLSRFLERHLSAYGDASRHPDDDAVSSLSPYLHFGHISAHQVFYEVMSREAWSPDRTASAATGKRSGWWGVSDGADAFLDQLITWRELGFNMCAHTGDYESYESLPEWARKTLAEHRNDPRPYLYDREVLEHARTHDPVWNAAQTQLVREGRLHNYMRMLWGKKILEWTPSPQEALETMIGLNNKYAADGRDPNSFSGIFWILGRYDRPWGPERPVFGKIRYMSSENTTRKLRVKKYLAQYGP